MSEQKIVIVNGVEINGSMPKGFNVDYFLNWVEQFRPMVKRVGEHFSFSVPVCIGGRESCLVTFSNPRQELFFTPIEPEAKLVFNGDGDVYFAGPRPIPNR